MMYKSRAEALEALRRVTVQWKLELRHYPIEGEIISPAEEWLVELLYVSTPVKRNDISRKKKRFMIGLGRSLGLYPIPEWWLVRRRVLRKEPKHFGIDDASTKETTPLVAATDEVLEAALALEFYIRNAKSGEP